MVCSLHLQFWLFNGLYNLLEDQETQQIQICRDDRVRSIPADIAEIEKNEKHVQ